MMTGHQLGSFTSSLTVSAPSGKQSKLSGNWSGSRSSVIVVSLVYIYDMEETSSSHGGIFFFLPTSLLFFLAHALLLSTLLAAGRRPKELRPIRHTRTKEKKGLFFLLLFVDFPCPSRPLSNQELAEYNNRKDLLLFLVGGLRSIKPLHVDLVQRPFCFPLLFSSALF